jgi:hypothetical protein
MKKWAIVAVLIVAALGTSLYFSRQQGITVPAKLKPVKEKIARCSIWIINDHGRPLVLSKLAELLEANNVACEREEYNIYYFSARFLFPPPMRFSLVPARSAKPACVKPFVIKAGRKMKIKLLFGWAVYWLAVRWLFYYSGSVGKGCAGLQH